MAVLSTPMKGFLRNILCCSSYIEFSFILRNRLSSDPIVYRNHRSLWQWSFFCKWVNQLTRSIWSWESPWKWQATYTCVHRPYFLWPWVLRMVKAGKVKMDSRCPLWDLFNYFVNILYGKTLIGLDLGEIGENFQLVKPNIHCTTFLSRPPCGLGWVL